jgi:hypothetical protein
MAELRSAIFWVLCPKQSLHCYINTEIPIKKLMDDLLAIFTMDSEIRKVIMSDEFPW